MKRTTFDALRDSLRKHPLHVVGTDRVGDYWYQGNGWASSPDEILSETDMLQRVALSRGAYQGFLWQLQNVGAYRIERSVDDTRIFCRWSGTLVKGILWSIVHLNTPPEQGQIVDRISSERRTGLRRQYVHLEGGWYIEYQN